MVAYLLQRLELALPTYLLAYRSSKAPTANNQNPMATWDDWFGEIRANLVDAGNPIFSTQAAGELAGTELGGYSLINAESLADAVKIASGAPTIPLGGGVEVGEITNFDDLRRSMR